jgi:hypothetical protein
MCTYVGETARNLYTRAREHVNKYKTKKTRGESFIATYQDQMHTGLPPEFKAEVMTTFKDSLSRIGIGILNSKSEWHQPALWIVQFELIKK